MRRWENWKFGVSIPLPDPGKSVPYFVPYGKKKMVKMVNMG